MSDEGEGAAKRAPKVTVREPDRAAVAKPRSEIVELADAGGRGLKARKIGALQRFDLALIMGPHSGNEGAMAPALLAWSVTEIGGEAVFPPATMAELRHLIQRLGDDGLEAVAQAYATEGWIETEPDKAAIKN